MGHSFLDEMFFGFCIDQSLIAWVVIYRKKKKKKSTSQNFEETIISLSENVTDWSNFGHIMVSTSDLCPINAMYSNQKQLKLKKNPSTTKSSMSIFLPWQNLVMSLSLETFNISGISPLVRFERCKGLKFLPCNFCLSPDIARLYFSPSSILWSKHPLLH